MTTKAEIGKDKHRDHIDQAKDAYLKAEKLLDRFLEQIQTKVSNSPQGKAEITMQDFSLLLNHIRSSKKVWEQLTEMEKLVIEAQAEAKILRYRERKASNE